MEEVKLNWRESSLPAQRIRQDQLLKNPFVSAVVDHLEQESLRQISELFKQHDKKTRRKTKHFTPSKKAAAIMLVRYNGFKFKEDLMDTDVVHRAKNLKPPVHINIDHVHKVSLRLCQIKLLERPLHPEVERDEHGKFLFQSYDYKPTPLGNKWYWSVVNKERAKIFLDYEDRTKKEIEKFDALKFKKHKK